MTTSYLPLAEAARRIGRSRDTLRRWIAQGRLKAVRLPDANGRLHVAESDLGLSEHVQEKPKRQKRVKRSATETEAERFLREEGVIT